MSDRVSVCGGRGCFTERVGGGEVYWALDTHPTCPFKLSNS